MCVNEHIPLFLLNGVIMKASCACVFKLMCNFENYSTQNQTHWKQHL